MKSHRPDFEHLRDVLRDICRDEPVYYFPNPGNWGDGLIRAGTLRFFETHGFQVEEHFRCVDFMQKPSGGTLIYGGSGAWCSFWNHAITHVGKLRRKFRVVVLPSTYEVPVDLPDDVTFFRRDHQESRLAMPRAHFCHDMAFALQDWPRSTGQGVGLFFRNDRERHPGRFVAPHGNVDLSNQGKHTTDIAGFMAAIDRYETIHTDRLHVAIGGCLLGKAVHLYPNGYFKLQAVYRSSIEGYFDRVVFHERVDALAELAPGA
ncbi:hypothetical protein KAK06_00050 [Ideonella sp. 4Y11]|uniref:Polysaccharide pyruvyl transferase domain-containing protein n=1 Tax=Ideonella aquatica TaxID=2824119 RepID=A0A940YGD0_9BURK|nr:hypothetical protein [Ideonella aquatica]MBQ0957334.1 hypothetical protein [Ideonella aquatica]